MPQAWACFASPGSPRRRRKRPRPGAARSWTRRLARSVGSALVAALCVLSPPWELAAASDVPVEAYFSYNGLHSDLAQQYYTKYKALVEVDQLTVISASDLPDDVTKELSTASVSWADLPGLLQRAILWDYGYALAGVHQLAKVYTRCGRSMDEIFVPVKAVERIGCHVQSCSGPSSESSASASDSSDSTSASDWDDDSDDSSSSDSAFYRGTTCDVDALARLALCAIDNSAVMPPSYSAAWGDGGESDSIPFVTARRHVWDMPSSSRLAPSASTSASSLLFALHTIQEEAAYGQCPSTPAMIIPCASYATVNTSRFCSPERGEVLSAWLTKYAADHKEDKTWLLVPLCIVTFVSVGVVAVYRYKAALRDQNQQLVDQFMRENRHLFDNGSVETFLVSRHGEGSDEDSDDSENDKMDKAARRYVRFQRRKRWRRKHMKGEKERRDSSGSISSGGEEQDDENDDESDSSENQDGSGRETHEGALNAAAFEYFDSAIGLSASAFDPLASSTRVHPLSTPHADVAMSRMLRSSRRNELAIRSFRLFESHKKIRRLRIQLRELQLLRLLSTGSTGEVWLAMHGAKQVAVKQLIPAKRRVLREMEMFLAEIYLLAQLKHRNIVSLVGIAWNTLEHVVMVQEFMETGDLMHYLASQRPGAKKDKEKEKDKDKDQQMSSFHTNSFHANAAMTSSGSINFNTQSQTSLQSFVAENRSFTWSKQRLQIAQAVAAALEYMHGLTPKLLHRDIKSRNVLLNSHMDAKLSDFGISRRKFNLDDEGGGATNNATVVGTMAWTAPELLLGEEYSEKVDIYSYGVLLAELDTCLLPYHDEESLADRLVTHPLRLMKRIVQQNVRPRLTTDCPPKIAQLFAACVHRDPRLRPSAHDIVALLASVTQGERGLLSRKSSSFAT